MSICSGVTAPRREAKADEEAVQAELDQLREQGARLESKGAAAAEGDFVVMDYKGYVDGEPFEGGEGRDQLVELVKQVAAGEDVPKETIVVDQAFDQTITQEIIELSRLQATDALSRPELVDIDLVVSMAIDQNRVAAESHEVLLVTKAKSGAHVYGDETLLVTALHNLIANAIQYSPDGSRVGVGVSMVDGVVEIAVTDQGAGIPEDELERVFERFFRTDPARSRHTGGSGLGLSIVKHAVQNHGGDVRVWSRVGSGSTFTIRLPQASYATPVTTGETL